jgi:hypothetical protein
MSQTSGITTCTGLNFPNAVGHPYEAGNLLKRMLNLPDLTRFEQGAMTLLAAVKISHGIAFKRADEKTSNAIVSIR